MTFKTYLPTGKPETLITLPLRTGLTLLPSILMLETLQLSKTIGVEPDLEYLNEMESSIKIISESILLTVIGNVATTDL